METRVFDRSERRKVGRAARLAESLTSGFYCIPGREWPRFPYDINTLAEGPGPDAPVFADVVRMTRTLEARPGGAARDLYRIRLRDDEILSAIHGASDLELYPLLLYVLTHELVHVVRFESGFAAYDTDDQLVGVANGACFRGVVRRVGNCRRGSRCCLGGTH